MKKFILTLFTSVCFAQTSPVVEPLNENECLVTLYCYAPGAEHVMVMGSLADDPIAHQMERDEEDSSYWTRTYRVPKDIRTTYWFSVDGPQISMKDIDQEKSDETTAAFFQTCHYDVSNPQTFQFGKEGPTFSVLELEEAPQATWCAEQDIPHGQLDHTRLKSVRLQNERNIWVYTPPGYSGQEEAYPTVLIFDGSAYTSFVPTPTILDNLIAAGEIPPTVAIFVGNVDRNRELPCDLPFAYFIQDEVMPWVRNHYNITDDPQKTVIAGSSYGGLAASFVALKFPETFGKVLSQSGGFWWAPAGEDYGWVMDQYDLVGSTDIEFYIDAGSLEETEYFGHPSVIASNREMRDRLQKRGHKVNYSEFTGGHDYVCWRVTFSDGLITLLGPKDEG